MVVLNAIESILCIVIMIAIGYVLTEKKWLDKSSGKVFTRLVCNISLPALMINNLMDNFDRDKLFTLGTGLIVPVLSMAICYLLGHLVCRMVKVKEGRRGTFISMFFVSNSIFIGLPVNMALFGEKSVPYVLIYYIANTTFFWTIGAYGISKDGCGKEGKLLSVETLKRIMSPPLMGFVVGLILILLNVHLPKFATDTCRYLGNLTTPLSMLFIGITIHSVKLKDMHFDKDVIAILIGRFVISPLSIYAIGYYCPVPSLMKQVFVIQAAMPVMTNTAIIANEYGADQEYATIMTVLTTLACLLTIPACMALIG